MSSAEVTTTERELSGMDTYLTTEFLLAVGQIIMIDIVLGGDNAVVIALACRQLPERQRRLGILYGTMGAILVRVVLIAFALALLNLPYVKLVGALLLIWIGVKLLSADDDGDHNVNSSDKLWQAVKTVVVADLVMSIDNVIAIAGAAEGAGGDHKLPLVVFGLLVSIPIIVWGSQLVVKLMDRFPIVISAGAGLIGYISGQMFMSDSFVIEKIGLFSPVTNTIVAISTAVGVIVIGRALSSKRPVGEGNESEAS